MKKSILALSSIILASVLLIISLQSAPANARFSPDYPTIEEVRMNIRYGGRAVAASVSPANPAIALVASESGGLFRTTNSGTTWEHVDALPMVHLTDVHIAPWPYQNMVLATGWADGHLPDDRGGIWRSNNGGTNWYKLAGSNPGCRPMVDAWSAAFGASSGWAYATTSCGLSISGDWGYTWPTTYTISADHMYFAVAADANNFYVCNNQGLRRGTGSTLGGFVSNAHGCNWSMHNLAISPLESGVVYMVDDSGILPPGCDSRGHAGRALYEGIYNSSTDQVTWTLVYNTCFRTGGRSPWVATNMSRDGIANHYDVYFGNGLKFFRNTCTSGGTGMRCPATDWQQVLEDHDDQNGLAFDPATRCAKYLVSDGGVHGAVDANNQTTCGSQFSIIGTPVNGYNALQVYELAGTNMSGGIMGPHTDLYAGTQDNSFWASENGGATWPHGCGNEGYHIEVPITGTNHASQWIPLTYHDAGSSANWATAAHFQGPTGTECQGMDVQNPVGAVMDSPKLLNDTATLTGGTRYLQYSEPITHSGNYQLNLGLSVPSFTPNYRYTWTWSAVNQTTYALEDRPQVPTNGSHITYYHPYRKPAQWTRHNDPNQGLIKVTGLHPDGTVDPSPPTTLANGSGSNSLSAMSTYAPGEAAWRWPTVYGVDPSNPNHLIAADTLSETMKVSLDGGLNWITDVPLTDLVTNSGEYHFVVHYDEVATGSVGVTIQAHAIGFDPFFRNHILVGTHNLGIIESFDGGESWGVISDTQKITNITDFFFMRWPPPVHNTSTFWVSTYGRGIWKVTESVPSLLYRITDGLAAKLQALVLDANTGAVIDPSIITDSTVCPQCQFLTVPHGEIWGLSASGGVVTGVHLYDKLGGHLIGSNNVGDPLNSDIPIDYIDSMGIFDDCAYCDDVYTAGNHIRGIVINKAALTSRLSAPDAPELIAIITSTGGDDLPGANQIEKFDAFAPESALGPDATPITDPYLRLEGKYAIGGEATIGNGDLLAVLGSGFSGDMGACGYVHISIDDEEIAGVNPYPDGTFMSELPITINKPGHHILKAEQTCGSVTLMDWARFMVVIEEEWWDYQTLYLPLIRR